MYQKDDYYYDKFKKELDKKALKLFTKINWLISNDREVRNYAAPIIEIIKKFDKKIIINILLNIHHDYKLLGVISSYKKIKPIKCGIETINLIKLFSEIFSETEEEINKVFKDIEKDRKIKVQKEIYFIQKIDNIYNDYEVISYYKGSENGDTCQIGSRNYFIRDKDVYIPDTIDVKDRICRFCGLKYSPQQVKFNRPHVLSQKVGNKKLLSVFECESCNSYFSRYENDFLNFIGQFYRLLFNNLGVKKYNHKGSEIIWKNNILCILTEENSDSNSLNKNDKIINLEVDKTSYYPVNVYKTLVKMALTLMPEDEINTYQHALNWLDKNKTTQYVLPSPMLGYYGFSTKRKFKLNALLLKRKTKTTNKPYFIFVLLFENYFFQIFLPFCKKDLLDDKFENFLFPFEHMEDFLIEVKDFSSLDKVTDDRNFISIENKGNSFTSDDKNLITEEILNINDLDIEDIINKLKDIKSN